MRALVDRAAEGPRVLHGDREFDPMARVSGVALSELERAPRLVDGPARFILKM